MIRTFPKIIEFFTFKLEWNTQIRIFSGALYVWESSQSLATHKGLGKYPGWSESLVCALSFCFCHALAWLKLQRNCIQSFSHCWEWIWAGAWQNQQNDHCAQRRLRSAWASIQLGQSSLSAWRGTGSLAIHKVHSSLLGAQVILLVLLCSGSKFSQNPLLDSF